MDEQVKRILDANLQRIITSAGVPVRTGRLKSAIKVRRATYGWDVYIDTGNYSLEEWMALDEKPSNIAPYAARVNEMNQYWRRLAFAIYDVLNRELGGEFGTQHSPSIRGGNNE